jgi:hypothetical protein
LNVFKTRGSTYDVALRPQGSWVLDRPGALVRVDFSEVEGEDVLDLMLDYTIGVDPLYGGGRLHVCLGVPYTVDKLKGVGVDDSNLCLREVIASNSGLVRTPFLKHEASRGLLVVSVSDRAAKFILKPSTSTAAVGGEKIASMGVVSRPSAPAPPPVAPLPPNPKPNPHTVNVKGGSPGEGLEPADVGMINVK